LLEKGEISLDELTDINERKARQKLLEQAIEAKLMLSATDQSYVSVANLVGDQHLDTEVTRDEFNEAIGHYVDKIDGIIERLFITGGLDPSTVDRVIRVGGSSQIPKMKELLEERLGEDKMYGNIDPSRSVAEGAAIYAAFLDDKEVLQGREIEVMTRTCHALGIEMAGGQFCPLIKPNRKTPCEVRQLFTTNSDNMTELEINVYQGSAKQVEQNSLIGTVTIPGLPEKPMGELDIWVTFKVSEDQTLSVVVETEGVRNAASLNFA
jgi:molecular chaperone DnaK